MEPCGFNLICNASGSLAAGGCAVKDKERWMELCEQAAKEQDRERLLQLVQEINRLLDEKQDCLNSQSSTSN